MRQSIGSAQREIGVDNGLLAVLRDKTLIVVLYTDAGSLCE